MTLDNLSKRQSLLQSRDFCPGIPSLLQVRLVCGALDYRIGRTVCRSNFADGSSMLDASDMLPFSLWTDKNCPQENQG
jgi:hypothetical protein